MWGLQEFVTDPHPCAYLPDRLSCLEYTYAPALTAEQYEELMNQGYRKFGPMVFRPVCEGCLECRPVRIPVASFQPDRSQRRAWKRNQGLEVRYALPVVDAERLRLYRRYHAAQAKRKGWPGTRIDAQEYQASFVLNPVPAVEISLWEEGTLRAIVLTDVTPNVVSGVYHYHDPDLSDRSLGTACMLHTLELARKLEKTWAYFGYYVAGCGSLEYKARFRPCERQTPAGVWETMP
jgi:leucyl-tRNA---protein transferase